MVFDKLDRPVFLAPIPIVHTQAMLDDIKHGHIRFAFGSNAIDFFEKNIIRDCGNKNILAYIYVSKSGEAKLEVGTEKKLGILVQGRLCGWTIGDNRGQYPKAGTARRPASAIEDGPMALFWEIDNIQLLNERLPLTEFMSTSSKPFSDDFVPQGPMLVAHRT